MESLNLLHLSDLHFGRFYHDDPASLAIKIGDILEANARKVDLIIVSGDIFDGRSNTYDKDRQDALCFFHKMIDQINVKSICDKKFDKNDVLFVPGNHDLIREDSNQFKKYDDFVNAFYDNGKSNKIKLIDGYNFICDFPEKKIAILGFNSCRIVNEEIKEEDLKWIDTVDLSGFKKNAESIRNQFKKHLAKEKNWDDFGYINPSEMDNVFNKLKKDIPSHQDYNLVAIFHHHFYPFPEIVKKSPDASFIRNYTDVLDKFQRYKVQLVLHGHKHISIQRAITDNKYFENPDSIIYVLAAGSIGCKDVYNRSFQWLRVYDRNYNKLADGEKYDFRNEEPEKEKPFSIPPQKIEEKSVAEHLTDTLQSEAPKLHDNYKTIIDNFEQVIQDSDIDKVVEIVGNLITVFPNIKIELRKNPNIIYVLLLAINYRVIFLKNQYKTKSERKINDLLNKLKKSLLAITNNREYSQSLLDFLSSPDMKRLDANYPSIIKNVSASEKLLGAYTSIALFLTDLFLNISRYGEFYFKNERLNYKVNIALEQDQFYDKIPSSYITLEPNVDRREIVVNFRCLDPTVHKVAVLIVKEFEMRLNKFEESLKEIKLKLYYIQPKVQPQRYDLENFHFDAYIPTLLPLLTGDNLYKQKEVFIRELVQNAIDATLLRKKIQPTEVFNTDILIELGEEVRDGKKVKYFKIKDNGIGMSQFTIERYFTSIGRSFYMSEEFADIKKDKNIQYNAISNFGIGFLSSFMVCKEVLVKTKSILSEDDSDGLQIEIPNYEGCFFITKSSQLEYGTEIILYADERNLFDFKKFQKYIVETFLGIPLVLNVVIKNEVLEQYTISDYSLQRDMLNAIKEKQHVFYIPFSEADKTPVKFSWKDLYDSSIESLPKYGIYFNLDLAKKNTIVTANQGLLISDRYLPFKTNKEDNPLFIAINFPSAFIQLDVAREKVVALKKGVDFSGLQGLLSNQVLSFLTGSSPNLLESSIYNVNLITRVLSQSMDFKIDKELFSELFILKITRDLKGINLGIRKRKEIQNKKNNSASSFCLDYQNENDIKSLLLIFEEINNYVKDEIEDYLKNDFVLLKRAEKGFTSEVLKMQNLLLNELDEEFMQDYKMNVEFETISHLKFIQNETWSNKTLSLQQRYSAKDLMHYIESFEKKFMRHQSELLLYKDASYFEKIIATVFFSYINNSKQINKESFLPFIFIMLKIQKRIFCQITVRSYSTFSMSLNFDNIKSIIYHHINDSLYLEKKKEKKKKN